MARTDPKNQSNTVSLELAPEYEWTLHHAVLTWIEQEMVPRDAGSRDPRFDVTLDAFQNLDEGRTTFTTEQLEAIQHILSQLHHSTSEWQLARSRFEYLLSYISDILENRTN